MGRLTRNLFSLLEHYFKLTFPTICADLKRPRILRVYSQTLKRTGSKEGIFGNGGSTRAHPFFAISARGALLLVLHFKCFHNIIFGRVLSLKKERYQREPEGWSRPSTPERESEPRREG